MTEKDLVANITGAVGYPGIFFRRRVWVQQIQLRTENRENGDLGM